MACLQGALSDGEAATAGEEPYQVDALDDEDLGIDEEELARLEAELGSADADGFGGSGSAAAELETGSGLPR